MKKSHITWVTEAAFLIAILFVIQLISFVVPKSVPLLSQLFTGSLVNLVLIVGSATIGLAATAVAAILSPVLAFVLGQMPFPQLILVVAIGNLVIVAISWEFFVRRKALNRPIIMDTLGIISGAIAKFLFLWGAIVWVMAPIFFAGNPKIASKISFMFSWPQLITALTGGIIALLILPAIRAYRNKE